MSAQPNVLLFPLMDGPQSLTEKYKPSKIADFTGIPEVKETMQVFCEKPYKSAWVFVGDSGTGKSAMAQAVAKAIDAQVFYVPSQECSVQNIRDIISRCCYLPMFGQRFNLVLVEEADSASAAALQSLLSTLDDITPQTVFIFTCNSTERFEPRFLSRNRILKFSNYGIQKSAAELLLEVWNKETNGKTPPNIPRLVKDANGNIRAALMALELELMLS
jgi:replication factor C subunit 2/4